MASNNHLTTNLTIVTVVKDDLASLERTISSIISQNSKCKLLIVSPNTDPTFCRFIGDLSQKHGNFRFLSDEGIGIYHAMNLALLDLDQNDWVWFLNAGDCLPTDDVLSNVIHYLRSASSKWMYGNFSILDSKGCIVQKVEAPSRFVPSKQLFAKSYICHQAVIAKNHFLTSLGGFDVKYKVAADWELFVRMSLQNQPTKLDFYLCNFMLGGFSSTNRQLANKELFEIRRKFLPKKYFPISAFWMVYRMGRNHLVLLLEKKHPVFLNRLRQSKAIIFSKLKGFKVLRNDRI